MTPQEQKIDALLSRGVAEVIDRDILRHRLLSGEKLRVKFGIDPTSPFIHLGRAVALRTLRDFQDLGHIVVFIVGDFTGVIGDTSDKESERPMLTADVVAENMRTYVAQAGKILNMDQVEVRYNAEWLSKLGYAEISEQADTFSLAEFIARDNIKKRLDFGKRVSLREVLYPLMQGYDSVAIRADVEIGGTDQRFNLLAGRHLQKKYAQPEQAVLTVNIIPGTDGRKMSSSWGNTINILDAPNDMFGKVMSIPDELIMEYFIHCTRVPMEEIAVFASDIVTGGNPRDIKMRLANEIVRLYHGELQAINAETYFIDTFSKKQIPTDIHDVLVQENIKISEVIVSLDLATSKTDARRKMAQGGVEIAGEKITDENAVIEKRFAGQIMKVGKKDFVKLLF
ncbi:MAG: tyrosine--tRNA ligase [Minisyncoccota bacterium]